MDADEDLLRGPVPDADDDDSGLGAAFDDEVPEETEVAPPLDDDAADDLLTR